MAAQLMLEKWSARVCVMNIGATKQEGGTRSKVVKVAGEATLPFLFAEASIPHKPVIAYEVWDIAPTDWPDELTKSWGKVLNNSLDWAQMCVKDYKADLLCVRLQGAHPDNGNKSAAESAKFISALLKELTVSMISVTALSNSLRSILPEARRTKCLFNCPR